MIALETMKIRFASQCVSSLIKEDVLAGQQLRATMLGQTVGFHVGTLLTHWRTSYVRGKALALFEHNLSYQSRGLKRDSLRVARDSAQIMRERGANRAA